MSMVSHLFILWINWITSLLKAQVICSSALQVLTMTYYPFYLVCQQLECKHTFCIFPILLPPKCLELVT